MTDTTHPAQPAPLQDDTPRRGATPLLWILLVLAVAALAWWLAAQRGFGTGAGNPGGSITVITPDDLHPASAGTATTAHARATARARSGSAASAAAATANASRGAALLAHEQPLYPVAAQRRGVEGTVMLRIAVDANGVPTDIGYAERSGDPDLDRAALAAARDWRFRPASRDGRNVATTVNVPVRFALPAARG